MSGSTAARARSTRLTPGLIAGLVLLGIIVVIGIVSPFFLTEQAETLTSEASQGPSAAHLLGTDDFGRDILARTLVATRLTLVMTTAGTFLAVAAGALLGCFVWLAPRRVRELGLRLIDAAVAYPTIVFALIIAAVLGAGTWSAVLAIAIANVPGFARVTANLAASVSQRNYVSTARLMDVPVHRIFSRHLLPNMAEPLLVMTASMFSIVLIELSSLSFVGLGVQNPSYDYGRLLNEALINLYSQPLQVIVPAVMITATGLAAILVGDGIAAATDPRSGRRFARGVRTLLRGAVPAARTSALVQVDGLTVLAPNGRTLVDDISFTIAPGEILGLVGESGSGKSMTAMALADLLPSELTVRAETMRIGDLDLLGTVDRTALATQVGLVYQDPGSTFNPALRMRAQLTETGRVHLDWGRTEADERIVAALESMRITEAHKRLGQHPHELSGGMLQRSMIASTLATDPRLIIADEPTTALDVTVQADVLRLFRAINRDRGTALLFISHDLGVVRALCDNVLVMKDGRIVERITADQIESGAVEHPYTKLLLAATPQLTQEEPAAEVSLSQDDPAHDSLGAKA
ncbi:dipeptide/oligopeptide/nickel ABC transporter permease/ATP-binding protein [Rathayibacter sp. SD072]|uniref:dipeptide/oligopeptide/nickel ABC transporter permease/ATP-binding protein n=1 Tax=Rathayibacter sp. SD072 TaxID=2781731 RepID=UPI001A95BE41|nr:dipeptide/oligopeptide/nickel ABC transporter permease/ATP-binding protein [Rathayibacter sp. SD072]MBO0982654.1 dipeptide/oligopeptide/nickel ABC transporter permease/ATP-binding protein [Rathayibacter sp. SD072]